MLHNQHQFTTHLIFFQITVVRKMLGSYPQMHILTIQAFAVQTIGYNFADIVLARTRRAVERQHKGMGRVGVVEMTAD